MGSVDVKNETAASIIAWAARIESGMFPPSWVAQTVEECSTRQERVRLPASSGGDRSEGLSGSRIRHWVPIRCRP